MKKWVILIIVIAVLGLGLSYRQNAVERAAANLIADAYRGDLTAVKNDVEDGAPLDYTLLFDDEERQYKGADFTALHAAASGGSEDVINFLLDEGLDINTATPNGWTPLFIAARDGRTEAAKLLVFRGADMNAQTDKGATALMMALTQKFPTETDRTDLITYMLKRGADPNLTTKDGVNALFYATVYKKSPALTQLLLEHGADTQDKNFAKLLAVVQARSDLESKKIARLLKKAAQKPAKK